MPKTKKQKARRKWRQKDSSARRPGGGAAKADTPPPPPPPQKTFYQQVKDAYQNGEGDPEAVSTLLSTQHRYLLHFMVTHYRSLFDSTQNISSDFSDRREGLHFQANSYMGYMAEHNVMQTRLSLFGLMLGIEFGVCPITLESPVSKGEPVIEGALTRNGIQWYSRSYLSEWLETNKTDPATMNGVDGLADYWSLGNVLTQFLNVCLQTKATVDGKNFHKHIRAFINTLRKRSQENPYGGQGRNWETFFLQAIQCNNMPMVKAMAPHILRGKMAETAVVDGRLDLVPVSFLWCALDAGEEISRTLFQNPILAASISKLDSCGRNLLHRAAEEGELRFVKTLLGLKCDPNTGVVAEGQAEKKTVEVVSKPALLFAVEGGDNLDVVNALIEAKAAVNALVSINGYRVLHYAAGRGKLPIVRALLAAKADPLLTGAGERRKKTPLELARTQYNKASEPDKLSIASVISHLSALTSQAAPPLIQSTPVSS